MKTYVLVVEYDGTNFYGFQRQQITGGGSDDEDDEDDEEKVKEQQEEGGSDDPPSGTTPPAPSPSSSSAPKKEEKMKGPSDRRKRPRLLPVPKNSNKGAENCKRLRTVQGEIEEALVRLTGSSVRELRVRGAGRTDKGVHATGQVVAFDLHDDKDEPEEEREEEAKTKAAATATTTTATTTASCVKKGEEKKKKKKKKKGRKKAKADGGDSSIFEDDAPGPSWRLRRALNSRLPKDASVRSARRIDDSFGAPVVVVGGTPGGSGSADAVIPNRRVRPFEPREGVALKRYTYSLRFRRKRTDPATGEDFPICSGGGPYALRRALDSPCLWVCPWSLDDRLLSGMCDALSGAHDFSCFVHRKDRRKKDNTIHLSKFDVRVLKKGGGRNDDEDGEEEEAEDDAEGEASPCDVLFTLEAPGFRRSMVRNLIGFVVDLCRGLRVREDIERVLTGTDEHATLVHSAPASGLCLSKVFYE